MQPILLSLLPGIYSAHFPLLSSEPVVQELPGLHNVVEFRDFLINGSTPDGDAGFESLVKLGVKTIISVDGALPDADGAERHGMRYVHIPIGYDGIRDEVGLALIRAVRDLPRPVYVHCFHGKHRSPAVAAYILVGLGEAKPDEVVALMRHVGTSENYTGLFDIVEACPVRTSAEIDGADALFPSRVEVTGITKQMVEIGRCWDRIGMAERADWTATAAHPDLDAQNETRILAELMDALVRDPEVQDEDALFLELLRDGQQSSWALHYRLKNQDDTVAVQTAYKSIEARCTACHERFRD